MAVTFRAKTRTTGTGTSATATEPVGTASGDMIVALSIAGAVISQPAGWTQLFKDTQGGVSWVVSYVARGGSAPNLGWTWAGSVYYELHLVTIKPGSGSVAFDSVSIAGSKGNSSAHNPDPPATTAVASSSLAVAGGVNFHGSSTGGWGSSAGYVVRSDNTAGNDAFIEDKTLSAAGSENPAAVTNVVVAGADDWWDGFTATFTDVAAATNPFINDYYPNPTRARRPNADIYYAQIDDATDNTLAGKDQFFAAPGEGPVYDYPNPRGKPFPIDNRTFFDPTEFWLLKDTFFGAAGEPTPNYDWPVPKGKPFPIDDRTFLDPHKPWLRQDTFFGAPGQGPRYDYPNPRLRRTVPDAIVVATAINLLSVGVVASPFFVTDWPNPRRALWAWNDPELVTLFPTLLQVTAVLPFSQHEWANPTGRQFSIDLRTFTQSRRIPAAAAASGAALQLILVNGHLAIHVSGMIYEFL